MEIIHTRNRAVAWGVLLSALVVGVVLTLGQVPLAVSQPVAIQAKMIKGPFRWTGPTPFGRIGPGGWFPLTGKPSTTRWTPTSPVKSAFLKRATTGREFAIRWAWP